MEILENEGKPRAIFINKIDIEGVDILKVIEQLKASFGNKVIPLTLPKYENGKLTGVEKVIDSEISELQTYKHEVFEIAAESDDSLLEKYLSGERALKGRSHFRIENALLKRVFPVLWGLQQTLLVLKNFWTL